MENYIECAVTRKNNLKDNAICFTLSLLPMFIGTYFVILLYAAQSNLFVLAILFCALLYFFAYKIFCSFSVDWEYTLVGNELRFSKIINKNKRRELMTVAFSKIEIMARVDDTNNNHQYNSTQLSKNIYTSQTGGKEYFFIGTTEKGQKVCVVFEPDDRMLDSLAILLKGKFFI